MTPPIDLSWQEEAACRGTPIAWWFPERVATDALHPIHSEAAKRCAACPVLAACYHHALHHENVGTWAGTSAQQRRKLRRAAGIRLDTTQSSMFAATAARLWRQGADIPTIADQLRTYPKAVYRALADADIPVTTAADWRRRPRQDTA